MKRIILFFICIVLFILDNSLMPFIAIKGIYPSLLFIFAISYSIISGYWEALFIGILSGLLQDVYFSNGLGINALTNMLMCLIAAKVGENIFRQKVLVPFISMFFLSIIKGILIFVMLYLANRKIYLENILYISIYNTILILFIYKRVYRLCKKNYMKKEWNF